MKLIPTRFAPAQPPTFADAFQRPIPTQVLQAEQKSIFNILSDDKSK